MLYISVQHKIYYSLFMIFHIYTVFSPVLWIGRKQISFEKSKSGNDIAEDVGAPQQRYPVVDDDGWRKPVEVLRIGHP